MTCTLQPADADDKDGSVVMSWLDGNGREVTSVTGRYDALLQSQKQSMNYQIPNKINASFGGLRH